MKRLILFRHAKSNWKHDGLSDRERPLSKRGKRDTETMARRLASRRIAVDRIVSSPAKRARKTATAVARVIGYPPDAIVFDEEIYGAGIGTLLEAVCSLEDDLQTVVLFGHNPGFTAFANYLCRQPVTHMVTAAIAGIEFDADSWSGIRRGSGSLAFFDYPKRAEQ